MVCIRLFVSGAAAVDCAGDVAVGRMKGLKGRAAGKFDLFETKLAEFPFLNFSDDAAIAFNACTAKSSHCLSPFFLSYFSVFSENGPE